VCTIVAITFAGLLPSALTAFDEIKGVNVEAVFPRMVNDMGGNATIVQLWHRPTLRREDCGQYCELDVCYDDYIVEVAWYGGPASGYFNVEGSNLISRLDGSCHDGPCDQYGGWKPLFSSTPGQETYERNTVSQGWKAYRCESDCHGHKCDDNGKRDNCADKYTVDYMRARTSCASKSIRWNEPILDRSGDVVQIASPGPDIDINASIMVYVPPVVADVPSFFRCPTALYNPLCVRVGDLATAELEEAAENRYIYMRAMAIVLGVFGFLCLNGWCFTAALYQMYQRNKRRFAERAAAAPPPQIVATVGQPVPVATAVPMVAATTVGQPVPVAMAVATPVA